ncbi:PREDICTED: protein CWC15 homolog isoform X2 [Populus euphratica]|uniref:Protein CWC15 homolog isoform X2 n=1 Tax=Populus euphratica TaxID=75702 RepID=A0AAJ6V0G8_POPEU|nr:PREDICTED: protein CWC15 homolog isoform X2 [Populus euphratica]
MTTAARPTWAPAKGGNEQGGTRIFGPSQKYSSRDLAAHTTLKPRKEGQDTKEELQKRNLREELEERERRHFSSKDKSYNDDRDRRKSNHLLLEGTKRDTEDRIIPRSVDADDSDVEVNNDDDSDDDDDDDDEDDTEALMAELERIKKERAEEKLRQDQLQVAEELKAKEEQLLRGNPLLNNPTTTFNVKRRWDDDVVFKNQARGETKTPKRFINDTIRNDFHRKFLQKYMK